MKKLLLSIALMIVFGTYATSTNYATCKGEKSCKACKNCKYCKHCAKDGGKCGVCKK